MSPDTVYTADLDQNHNRAHSDLNTMIRQAAERDYAFAVAEGIAITQTRALLAIADHLRAIRIHLENA